jgi:uncharacterized protein
MGGMILLQGCVSDNIPEQSGKKETRVEVEMKKQFIQAAERKETEKIKRLIEEGIEINTKDSDGRTAIMIATYNNASDLPICGFYIKIKKEH